MTANDCKNKNDYSQLHQCDIASHVALSKRDSNRPICDMNHNWGNCVVFIFYICFTMSFEVAASDNCTFFVNFRVLVG